MAVVTGEVWQDGEGTLAVALTPSEDGRDSLWGAFLNDQPILGTDERMVYPLTRVFDDTGKNVGGDLNYPNGSALRD